MAPLGKRKPTGVVGRGGHASPHASSRRNLRAKPPTSAWTALGLLFLGLGGFFVTMFALIPWLAGPLLRLFFDYEEKVWAWKSKRRAKRGSWDS